MKKINLERQSWKDVEAYLDPQAPRDTLRYVPATMVSGNKGKIILSTTTAGN